MAIANRALKYLSLLAVFLFIIAISSFWFGNPSFSEKNVTLGLESPLQASAGDEVVYKIKYANATKTTLYNLNFLFFYPTDSTVIQNGTTVEGQTENFTIDHLAPGQKGEKEFKVFLVGEKGNIKSAKVNLSFKSGNLQSSFEKSALTSTTITAMPIDLTLVSPPNATAGQSIDYILDYRNTSGDDASDLLFEFTYPDGFSPKQFMSPPQQGNNVWLVPVIKKGAGKRISIQGTLDGKEGDSKSVMIQLKRKIGNIYVNYEKASSVTVISNPILRVEILANESSDYSAYPGAELRYVIKYTNSSNLNLSGLNLTVKLEGEMLDFASLNTQGGFFDDATKTILWNSSIVPDFINLSPGAKGQVTFQIALKSSFASNVSGASKDRFAKATAKLSTPNVPPDSNADELAAFGSSITKIGTQPTFNAIVYYNDPVFGATGPLPPKVGEESYFTIHWQIINPGNDINGVVIKGKLPTGVSWVDRVNVSPDNPKPVFNPNTQEVEWDLPTVRYGVGLSSPKYDASLSLKIKPSSTQKGVNINLMQNIQFSGTDNFTKQSVIISKKDLSTDNLVDRPKEGAVQ